jgi:hypothetical protein
LDGQRCAWFTAGLADDGGEEHERRNLVEGEAVFVSGRHLSLGRLGFNLVSLGAHG